MVRDLILLRNGFAEPSIGMHLGRLGDETYTTNSGIEVEQDLFTQLKEE